MELICDKLTCELNGWCNAKCLSRNWIKVQNSFCLQDKRLIQVILIQSTSLNRCAIYITRQKFICYATNSQVAARLVILHIAGYTDQRCTLSPSNHKLDRLSFKGLRYKRKHVASYLTATAKNFHREPCNARGREETNFAIIRMYRYCRWLDVSRYQKSYENRTPMFSSRAQKLSSSVRNFQWQTTKRTNGMRCYYNKVLSSVAENRSSSSG